MTEASSELTYNKRLKKRHQANKRLYFYGILAIVISCSFLVLLLSSIFLKGYTAFIKTTITLPVTFTPSYITQIESADGSVSFKGKYRKLVRESIKNHFPSATTSSERRQLYRLFSKLTSQEVKDYLHQNPDVIGSTIPLTLTASSDVDIWVKGGKPLLEDYTGSLNEKQLTWLHSLDEKDYIKQSFNTTFITGGDSREPEIAGIFNSMIGSFFTILVCIGLAFPLGILTAIYLEEYASKNRLTDLIEINLNNLAAVPSIIYGILGLAIYLNFMHLPRSASLVGGLTLALMVLPIIVITTRNSICAIPPSIKEGAIALGASPMQVTLHHTLPLALPGIMTGTILSISRALGETAPLLMIGMVAFIIDTPKTIFDPATALPVQIYLWADSPELGFVEKTSAAIIVLLAFLLLANAIAIYLRKKFERSW